MGDLLREQEIEEPQKPPLEWHRKLEKKTGSRDVCGTDMRCQRWLYAGPECDGGLAAIAYALIETAAIKSVDARVKLYKGLTL